MTRFAALHRLLTGAAPVQPSPREALRAEIAQRRARHMSVRAQQDRLRELLHAELRGAS